MTDLSHLVQPGGTIDVRVTPRASRDAVVVEGGKMRIYVTCVPEGGKANARVVRLLAKAICVAPSRLTLLRGAKGRDKQFRLD